MRESLRVQDRPSAPLYEIERFAHPDTKGLCTKEIRLSRGLQRTNMNQPTSPGPTHGGQEQKKSQSREKGFLKKTKHLLRGTEQKEQKPDNVRAPGQPQPIQAQKPPRKQSSQAPSSPMPTKQREAEKGDSIAILNMEAEGIQRQWSMGITENKDEIPHSGALTHLDTEVESMTVSRRAMNGHNHPVPPAAVGGQIHHGPSAVPMQNASLTFLRAPHAANETAPLHSGNSALVTKRPNVSPLANTQHGQQLGQQSCIGIDSQNHKMLKSELEAVKDQSNLLQKQLRAAQEQLSHVQHLDREHQALRSEHEQVLQDVDDLQAARDHAANEAVKLAEENTGLREDVKTWHSRFSLVNTDLLEARADNTSSSKVDDKWFGMQWGDLQVKIEALSHQYFLGRLSRPGHSILERAKGSRPEKLENQPSKAITRLTDSYSRYLKSEYDRPLLIQAFLWCVLVNSVFDHSSCNDGGFYWAGQSRSLLYHLRLEVKPIRPLRHKDAQPYTPSDVKRLEKEMKDFNKWRAETAIMMLAKEPVTKRIRNISGDLASLIAEILDEIAPYIVVTKDRPLAATEPDLKEQLRIILITAIEVDAEIARQRARIFCEQWRGGIDSEPFWGFPVNPEDSETITTADQKKSGAKSPANPVVELIVQPALFREGNQYGEEYDLRHALSKAKVVVGENLALPAGRRW